MWLVGDHEMLGNGQVEHALPLQYLDRQFWQIVLALPTPGAPDEDITYHYILRNPDGSTVEDWGQGRVVNPSRFSSEEVLIVDAWNHAGYFENAFYTEPFKSVLLKPNWTELHLPAPPTATHTFRVRAPLLTQGQTLCLLGEGSVLGNWNTDQPALLSRKADEDFFTAQLDLSPQTFPIAYKYGVYDLERKALVRYEDGANRTLDETFAPH
jgi:4-alpha-glucanotransferase